ncbi:hypothetical protein HMI54_008054 [Coelomomyces lativittatus]|nr:hypothetical protein HMI56_003120 [Coelomomyces lativittatus]KAJ1503471.1 hypothetical protein HMI54_008054 [Coelomomyces lativittatus]KAJ1513904.1 hypothetical protein HMI55_005131 [Coelomomyces lativittatus]
MVQEMHRFKFDEEFMKPLLLSELRVEDFFNKMPEDELRLFMKSDYEMDVDNLFNQMDIDNLFNEMPKDELELFMKSDSDEEAEDFLKASNPCSITINTPSPSFLHSSDSTLVSEKNTSNSLILLDVAKPQSVTFFYSMVNGFFEEMPKNELEMFMNLDSDTEVEEEERAAFQEVQSTTENFSVVLPVLADSLNLPNELNQAVRKPKSAEILETFNRINGIVTPSVSCTLDSKQEPKKSNKCTPNRLTFVPSPTSPSSMLTSTCLNKDIKRMNFIKDQSFKDLKSNLTKTVIIPSHRLGVMNGKIIPSKINSCKTKSPIHSSKSTCFTHVSIPFTATPTTSPKSPSTNGLNAFLTPPTPSLIPSPSKALNKLKQYSPLASTLLSNFPVSETESKPNKYITTQNKVYTLLKSTTLTKPTIVSRSFGFSNSTPVSRLPTSCAMILQTMPLSFTTKPLKTQIQVKN